MVREIVGDPSGCLGGAPGRAGPETTIRIQTSKAARGHQDVRLYHGNESRGDRRRPIWPQLSRTKSRMGSVGRMMHNKLTSVGAAMTLLFHAVAPSRGASEFNR